MNASIPTAAGTPLPPSPCVGICTLKGDYCYGCGRTTDEIAAWGSLTSDGQSAIWAQLPGRLAAFGFKTFRLAAGPAVVNAFIGRTFRETTGRWRLVGPNFDAGFPVSAEQRPTVGETSCDVTAHAASGDWLRLLKHEKVRVFGFASSDEKSAMDTIALVLPKGRAQRDLDDSRLVTPNGYFDVAPPDPFTEVMVQQVGGHSDAASIAAASWDVARAQLPAALATGHVRLALRNALGGTVTSAATFFDPMTTADANAPPDLKISRAFVAGAVFHCDDPAWLAAALAP